MAYEPILPGIPEDREWVERKYKDYCNLAPFLCDVGYCTHMGDDIILDKVHAICVVLNIQLNEDEMHIAYKIVKHALRNRTLVYFDGWTIFRYYHSSSTSTNRIPFVTFNRCLFVTYMVLHHNRLAVFHGFCKQDNVENVFKLFMSPEYFMLIFRNKKPSPMTTAESPKIHYTDEIRNFTHSSGYVMLTDSHRDAEDWQTKHDVRSWCICKYVDHQTESKHCDA
jgi:hypothetical protein